MPSKTNETKINEFVEGLARKYQDQFIYFVSVDPRKGSAAAQQLTYAVQNRGAKGVKVHPIYYEIYPNDKTIYPIYKAAEQLGVPVIFHTGPSAVGLRIKYGHPIYFDDVALDFPGLNMILAHFSGPWYMDAHALAWRYENVFVDISFYPFSYLKTLPWTFFEETSPDKILFGTDYPFTRYKKRLDEIYQLPISEKTRRGILGENASKILNSVS